MSTPTTLALRYNTGKPPLSYLMDFDHSILMLMQKPLLSSAVLYQAMSTSEVLTAVFSELQQLALKAAGLGDEVSIEDHIYDILVLSHREYCLAIGALWGIEAGVFASPLCDELCRVFAVGAKIYARGNWTKGLPLSTTLDSALRHLQALQRGQETDKESGLSNWAHLVWNVLVFGHFAHISSVDEGKAELNDLRRT